MTARDEVQVWTAEVERLPARRAAALARMLSADERARLGRFLLPDAREQYLVAHAGLRLVLSACARWPPEAWCFGWTTLGKPFVVAPEAGRAIRFSLSHTRGRVMIALRMGGDVGVDVEQAASGACAGGIAGRVLAAPELAALQALPEIERPWRFLRYWTLKEAILKALGCGLSLDPRALVVDAASAAPRLLGCGAAPPQPECWSLRAGELAGTHAWALAVPDPSPGTEPIAVRHFSL